MGQQINKYHVSDDGNIFKVNEDGSFTGMGNVEVMSRQEHNAVKPKKRHKWRFVKVFFILLFIAVLCAGALCFYLYAQNPNYFDGLERYLPNF